MFKKPSNPMGHVYYARLRTPQGTYYKLGYTSKSTLSERMSYGDHGDEKLIERELFFTFREDAWDVEQTLLDHFDKHRAFGKYSNDPLMPLSGRGQSELFALDILGIDDELNRLTEHEKKAIEAELDETRSGCLMALVGLVLAPFTWGLSLFLIAGGLSGVFSFGKGRQTTSVRAQHPPTIKKLIDALNQRVAPAKSTA